MTKSAKHQLCPFISVAFAPSLVTETRPEKNVNIMLLFTICISCVFLFCCAEHKLSQAHHVLTFFFIEVLQRYVKHKANQPTKLYCVKFLTLIINTHLTIEFTKIIAHKMYRQVMANGIS